MTSPRGSRHTGRGQLLARLADQVGSLQAAKDILIKRGHMFPDGRLTAAGAKRNNMTAAERAVDRARKASGHPARAYKYDPRTNRATLRQKR